MPKSILILISGICRIHRCLHFGSFGNLKKKLDYFFSLCVSNESTELQCRLTEQSISRDSSPADGTHHHLTGGTGTKLRDTVSRYHNGHLNLGPNTASFPVTCFEVKSWFPMMHHFCLDMLCVCFQALCDCHYNFQVTETEVSLNNFTLRKGVVYYFFEK